MATEQRIDRGDHILVIEGEPTWDAPDPVWRSVRAEWKPGTTQDNADVLRQRAATALQGNRDYLAIGAPNNSQVRDQVAALTRQVNALIRLVGGQLDGTD